MRRTGSDREGVGMMEICLSIPPVREAGRTQQELRSSKQIHAYGCNPRPSNRSVWINRTTRLFISRWLGTVFNCPGDLPCSYLEQEVKPLSMYSNRNLRHSRTIFEDSSYHNNIYFFKKNRKVSRLFCDSSYIIGGFLFFLNQTRWG